LIINGIYLSNFYDPCPMTKSKSKQGTVAPVPMWPLNLSGLDKVFDNFRREFEQSLFTFPTLAPTTMSSMRCDVVDEGSKYVVKLDIPGVKKDEIKVSVYDNSLEVSAKHKEEEEEKKKNYLRKERSEVSFYRLVPLPEKVVSNKAQAKLSDGVLDIIIPKQTPTKSQSSTIQVQ
jgi:HSP20 family protein